MRVQGAALLGRSHQTTAGMRRRARKEITLQRAAQLMMIELSGAYPAMAALTRVSPTAGRGTTQRLDKATIGGTEEKGNLRSNFAFACLS